MPTIPVPNTIMAEMIFFQHGVRMQNVLHFTVPGVPTIADLISLRNILILWDRQATNTATNLCTTRHTQNSLLAVKTTSLHGQNDIFDEYLLPVSSIGTRAVIHAAFVTQVVKLGTGFSDRNKRGRIYHCGFSYVIGNDGLVAIVDTAALQACYARMKADTLAGGFTLVIASKYDGVQIINGYRRGIPRAQGITTPVTTVTVERGADTRRSRKLPHLA